MSLHRQATKAEVMEEVHCFLAARHVSVDISDAVQRSNGSSEVMTGEEPCSGRKSFLFSQSVFFHREAVGKHLFQKLTTAWADACWEPDKRKDAFLASAERTRVAYNDAVLSINSVLQKNLTLGVVFDFALSDDPETRQEQLATLKATLSRRSKVYVMVHLPRKQDPMLKNQRVWPFTRTQVRTFVDNIWGTNGTGAQDGERLSDFVYAYTAGAELYVRRWLSVLRQLVKRLPNLEGSEDASDAWYASLREVTVDIQSWYSQHHPVLSEKSHQSYLRTHVSAGGFLWPVSQSNVRGMGRPFIYDDLDVAPELRRPSWPEPNMASATLPNIPNRHPETIVLHPRSLVRSQSCIGTVESPELCPPGRLAHYYRRTRSVPWIHIDTSSFLTMNKRYNSICNSMLKQALVDCCAGPSIAFVPLVGPLSLTSLIRLPLRINAQRKPQDTGPVNAAQRESLLDIALQHGCIPSREVAFGLVSRGVHPEDESTMYVVPLCCDMGTSTAAQFTQASMRLPPCPQGAGPDYRPFIPCMLMLHICLLIDDGLKRKDASPTFHDILPVDLLDFNFPLTGHISVAVIPMVLPDSTATDRNVMNIQGNLTITAPLFYSEALRWLETLPAPAMVTVPHNHRAAKYDTPLPVFADIVFKWPSSEKCVYVFVVFAKHVTSMPSLERWIDEFQQKVGHMTQDFYLIVLTMRLRSVSGTSKLLEGSDGRVLIVDAIPWMKNIGISALADQVKSMEQRYTEAMAREGNAKDSAKTFLDLAGNEMFMNMLLDSVQKYDVSYAKSEVGSS